MAAWHEPSRGSASESLLVTALALAVVLVAFGVGCVILWKIIAPLVSLPS